MRPDAVLIPGDTFFVANAARVAELGRTYRIPVIGPQRLLADAGALASFGSNLDVVSRRAAGYVHRILNGARPGDLPVELPTRYELVINLATARAIGLDVPASMLAEADDVIR